MAILGYDLPVRKCSILRVIGGVALASSSLV